MNTRRRGHDPDDKMSKKLSLDERFMNTRSYRVYAARVSDVMGLPDIICSTNRPTPFQNAPLNTEKRAATGAMLQAYDHLVTQGPAPT